MVRNLTLSKLGTKSPVFVTRQPWGSPANPGGHQAFPYFRKAWGPKILCQEVVRGPQRTAQAPVLQTAQINLPLIWTWRTQTGGNQ